MNNTCPTIPEGSARVCRIAELLEKHGKSFGLAASDAIAIAGDLDDALYGLAKDLTPADVKAVDPESLRVARDNLEDLITQAQEAFVTIERIITLRMTPDAQWPA